MLQHARADDLSSGALFRVKRSELAPGKMSCRIYCTVSYSTCRRLIFCWIYQCPSSTISQFGNGDSAFGHQCVVWKQLTGGVSSIGLRLHLDDKSLTSR